MTATISLQKKIIHEYIDPELEPQNLKKTAQREFGYDTEAYFDQYEFKCLSEQFFEKIIVPIENYLKTEEAQKIDNQAPMLNAREIFRPVVEQRLKERCTVIPGGRTAYPPMPSFWSWLATQWNGINSTNP